MDVKIDTVYEFYCPKCRHHQKRDYLIRNEFLKCSKCHEKFSIRQEGLNVKILYNIYEFSCEKCGCMQRTTNLIRNEILECSYCFHRYTQDKNGIWQVLNDPTERTLRRRQAGLK
jgi:hypothetical protein